MPRATQLQVNRPSRGYLGTNTDNRLRESPGRSPTAKPFPATIVEVDSPRMRKATSRSKTRKSMAMVELTLKRSSALPTVARSPHSRLVLLLVGGDVRRPPADGHHGTGTSRPNRISTVKTRMCCSWLISPAALASKAEVFNRSGTKTLPH